MAEYLINDSTLTAIGNAIRAKTGGVSLMTPAQMVTEIGNIPTGGSLPSVISHIDGGSFTLANDTSCGGYDISHSMGVTPKGFAIWTEDEISGTVATRLLGSCSLVAMNLVNQNSVANVSGGIANILYNGNISGVNVQANSATTLNYMNSSRIKWNNNLVYYKSGVTYKWLAWA